MNAVAAKAVCFRQAAQRPFKSLQCQTLENARCLAADFADRGYDVVSGGTDTHLVLLDLRSKGLSGAQAQKQLEGAGLIVNRNPVPGHHGVSGIDGGLRLGTPAITARGMKEPEVGIIVECIDAVLKHFDHEETLASVKNDIAALCRRFPLHY